MSEIDQGFVLPTEPPPAPRKPSEWLTVPLAYALRRSWHKGYRLADLRADLMAGFVVGIVALPLSMALAIAVGVPPQHGLYTAIIAGAVVALLGGCKFQVTGPTAAFVVVLAPIVTKHGLNGLLVAGFMAGAMLVVMGFARFGSFIQYIPHPVTTGFTTGIATVIATLQLKDVFGLSIPTMPEHFFEKLTALWNARGTANLVELGVATSTLALLVFVPRVIRRVPAPLIALGLVSGVCAAMHALFPSFVVSTIGTRFHHIPPALPSPTLPWGAGFPTFSLFRELFPAAFAIAMLGAIESLLSAVIADGMTNTKHDPNSELVALGIGNLVAPLFGGIAATGALARTATNIRAGARSPIAAVTHAVVVLLAILALSPLVAYVPMAALAALLLLVAWNMSEIRSFIRLFRIAPKSDVSVLLTCFVLTVAFDMVIAVSVGFVLAAILFMRRMAVLTETRFELDHSRDGSMLPLPPGALLYEINGPLFFGAAQRAMSTLGAVRDDRFQVLVIHLGRVPVIDATGLVALESAVANVLSRKKNVVLAGPLPRPQSIFDHARLEARYPGLLVTSTLAKAAVLAESLANGEHPASFVDGSGKLSRIFECVTKRRVDVVFQPVMHSSAMRELDRVLRIVAPKDVIVTLMGESGTGKEILARRLHELSLRHDGPFVPINCAAIPEALFESELFGHEKGAFTGASDRVRGKVEAATGGTLFLDEIAEMPLAAQAKLLRFLEHRRFMRVGGSVKITADVRLVTATLRPLEEEVRAGRFRGDLFYRIEGITLDVPPLRERIADIAPLVHELVAETAAKHGTKPPRLGRSTMLALRQYAWPGNVRELQNAIQLLCLLREGKSARVSDLPARIRSGAPNGTPARARSTLEVSLDEPLETSVERILAGALALESGNRSRAAERLSVSLRTMQRHAARSRPRDKNR